MNKLDSRKEEILTFIVDSFVKTAIPVGSQTLAKRVRVKLSSSTLRNEMSELEELGLVTHPHTSAGRVPTDKGYRYFVNYLMHPAPPQTSLANRLGEAYADRFRSMEDVFERTLKVLSTLSHQTSLIFVAEGDSFILKSVSLVPLEGSLLLVVWLSRTGLTKSFVIDMGERLSGEELVHLNRFLNQELEGRSYSEIRGVITQKFQNSRDSLKNLAKRAEQIARGSAEETSAGKIYFEGSAGLLDQPEFQDIETARPLFQMLETKRLIQKLLQEDLNAPGVTVRIGSEIRDASFRHFSLVSAPCRLGNYSLGSLGILGPRRMPYGEMIGLLSQVSSTMNSCLERWFR